MEKRLQNFRDEGYGRTVRVLVGGTITSFHEDCTSQADRFFGQIVIVNSETIYPLTVQDEHRRLLATGWPVT